MGLRILTIVIVLKEKSLDSNIMLVYTNDSCFRLFHCSCTENARKINKLTKLLVNNHANKIQIWTLSIQGTIDFVKSIVWSVKYPWRCLTAKVVRCTLLHNYSHPCIVPCYCSDHGSRLDWVLKGDPLSPNVQYGSYVHGSLSTCVSVSVRVCVCGGTVGKEPQRHSYTAQPHCSYMQKLQEQNDKEAQEVFRVMDQWTK
jgi:hypothetical protein